MKKLNNNGFAITSILYSIMVLFLMLLLSILGILGSRKAILDKNKKEILENLNSEVLNNKFNFEHRNITIINNGNTDDIVYALMDGVTAVDENGNQISSDNISYNLDINNIENRDYTVTYIANNNGKTIIGTRKITFTDNDIVSTFSYKDEAQEFIPSYNGSYKVELWGAQGGSYSDTLQGGLGAYTKGIIHLINKDILYIYVGEKGGSDITLKQNSGGYNGGGLSGHHNSAYSFGGGGATDIRLSSESSDNFDSLKSRLIVAAGGGGTVYHSAYSHVAGYGGGLIGGIGSGTHNSGLAYGGTQISGGEGHLSQAERKGSFGIGGSGVLNGGWGGGGGAGYYGGALGFGHGGGGGSSFISGYDGCDAIAEESTEDNIIHTGQSIHYSGYKFDNAVMYAGNESMPTHDGTGTMIGNNGDGYAKISLIYYY